MGKALEQIQREMDRWNEESYNVSLIYEENESLKHENRELKKQIEDIRRQQEAVTEEKPSFFRLLIALFDRSKIKKSQQENRDVRTEYLISLLTDVGLSPRAIDILEEAYESGFSVEELKHLYETSEEEMEDEYRKTCYRREKRIRFERAQRYRGEQSGGI
ncbi:MAG: hypothetical protein J6N77_05385 [Lachnospiraceae bacterium]|nr:hypothetical protein [Lachnospiraceae bacterium]